jgi:hypothetical protein
MPAVSPLPDGLRGPATVVLAKAEEGFPTSGSLPGGAICELKWDAFRCVIVRSVQGVRLWFRQGKELASQIRDNASAPLISWTRGPSSLVSWCSGMARASIWTSCSAGW